MDQLRLGRALLIPGAIIFGVRALISLAGGDLHDVRGLGPATGITGALSALGMVLFLVGSWKTDFRGQAALAFGLTGFGHYVLAPASQDAGAAFVYLGLGLASPFGVLGGIVAAVGALMRGDHVWAHGLVVLGLAVVLAGLWMRVRSKHE